MALTILAAITLNPILKYDEIPPLPPKITDVKGLIVYHAKEYGVSSERMEKTLFCESSLLSSATNINRREHSVGIAQINLLAHKDVTEEQARDNDFAIEWTAKAFSEGKQNMWSCYTKIYGRK